jgi:hypothetical protein
VSFAAPASPPASPSKKELNTAKAMEEKAVRLDRDTFGVGGGHGPWQRRLAEIGGGCRVLTNNLHALPLKQRPFHKPLLP